MMLRVLDWFLFTRLGRACRAVTEVSLVLGLTLLLEHLGLY
ncbi:hypothetical protein ABZ619_38965 [Streptomyces sp. NPDC007851]